MDATRDRLLTSRRLITAGIIFGLFILFDLLLFGWLIFNSLSQREIEQVLLETREQAAPVAAGLAERAVEHNSRDLSVVVSVAEETKTYIDSVLSQRQLVRSVEIRDRDGRVVYQKSSVDDRPLIDTSPPRVDRPGELLEAEVPIGELGTLVIGLSEQQVQERIGVLRRDLTRQASIIGGFTVLLLVVGLIAFLRLFQRARGLQEQAIEAERMAYVGTLASGLAHEIRSPLNSLSLNMQMLEEEAREVGGSSSQRQLLSITRSELGRLERLATDFLAYAKPRAIDLKAVPMVALLRRLQEVVGAEARSRGVAIDVEDRSGGRALVVDPSQINQLLLNLAYNALAAVEGISRPPSLRLVARLEDGDPVIEVIDNGQGIPAATRERIFDLFYSNRRGGTGLGLAIVQRIANLHDAKIEIDSVVDDGTTVRLRFPKAEVRRSDQPAETMTS